MDPDQELAKERHRNLTIWKEAMALVNDVYTTTKTFPKDEVWGRLRLPTRPFEKAQMHFCSDAEGGQDCASRIDRPSTQKAQSDQMTTSGDSYPIHLDLLRNLIRN